MNQHIPVDEWESLQSEWRNAGGAASSRAAIDHGLARMRRARLLVPIVEGGIALGMLVATAGALAHAANAWELVLGVAVGAAIAMLWIQRIAIRHREHGADALGSVGYLAFLRGVRRQQMQLAQFIWIVLAVDLIFFVPWWVRGGRVHPRTLTNSSSWIGMYLPIAMMIALLVWAIRVRRAAHAGLDSIDELSAAYRDAED